MKQVYSDARFGVSVFPFDVDDTLRTIRSKLLSATAIHNLKADAAALTTVPINLADPGGYEALIPKSLRGRIATFLRRREQVHPGDPPRLFRDYDSGRLHNVTPSHALAAGGRPVMMKVLQK